MNLTSYCGDTIGFAAMAGGLVLAALAGLLLPSARRVRHPAEGDYTQVAVITSGVVATDKAHARRQDRASVSHGQRLGTFIPQERQRKLVRDIRSGCDRGKHHGMSASAALSPGERAGLRSR